MLWENINFNINFKYKLHLGQCFFFDDLGCSVSESNDLMLWENICQSIDRILLWFKSNRLTANSEKIYYLLLEFNFLHWTPVSRGFKKHAY